MVLSAITGREGSGVQRCGPRGTTYFRCCLCAASTSHNGWFQYQENATASTWSSVANHLVCFHGYLPHLSQVRLVELYIFHYRCGLMLSASGCFSSCDGDAVQTNLFLPSYSALLADRPRTRGLPQNSSYYSCSLMHLPTSKHRLTGRLL